jgi:hypothetical protein
MARFAEIAGLVLLMLASAACGDGDDDKDVEPHVDCVAPIPTFTELQQTGVFDVCTNCHSSARTTQLERQDAPVGVDFDTYVFAKDQARQAAKAVNDGSMPKSPWVLSPESKRTSLIKWGLCGAPQ